MLALTPACMKNRGFTLIELMVVLAIAAIIATLAAPSFQRIITQQKISTAASDLLVSAMQARSEAIKNNRAVLVQPLVSTDWSRGWQIYIDTDGDRTFSSGDTLITKAPAADTNIVQDAAVFAGANYIGYNASGFVISSNAGRVVFAANPSIDYKKGVKISRIGRARACTSKPGDDGCAADASND